MFKEMFKESETPYKQLLKKYKVKMVAELSPEDRKKFKEELATLEESKGSDYVEVETTKGRLEIGWGGEDGPLVKLGNVSGSIAEKQLDKLVNYLKKNYK